MVLMMVDLTVYHSVDQMASLKVDLMVEWMVLTMVSKKADSKVYH
jgi:hypothetical protein